MPTVGLRVETAVRSPVADPDLGDPFDGMPAVGTMIERFLLGLVLMIVTLWAIGFAITEVGLLEPLRDWDESVNESLATGRSDWAVWTARRLSEMGDTAPVVGIMALVTIVLAVRRRWRAMLFLPVAMAAEITTFLAANYLVQRPRPAVERLGPLPGTYSFPSGHIAATFVCWMCCALLLYAYRHVLVARLLAAVGVIVSVGIGWARVYVGMHHTIDVVAGLAMGVASVLLAVEVLRRRLARTPGPAHDATTAIAESQAV